MKATKREEGRMRTVDELIEEVEENVEFYYEDIEVDVDDIPRLAVEDVLYGISLPETAITQYWDKLIMAAVSKYEMLSDTDRF